MTEISDRDIQIAHRLSSRYTGTTAFGREDAYQACLEGFFKAGCPKDEGLVVHVMRSEMRRQSVEAAYLMRVPYSSWKKMDETPVQVKHTGLSTEALVEYESPAAAISDGSFEGVEDNLAWAQAFEALTQWEIDVLNWALAEWRRGKRPSGKRVKQFKRARAHLKAILEGET